MLLSRSSFRNPQRPRAVASRQEQATSTSALTALRTRAPLLHRSVMIVWNGVDKEYMYIFKIHRLPSQAYFVLACSVGAVVVGSGWLVGVGGGGEWGVGGGSGVVRGAGE